MAYFGEAFSDFDINRVGEKKVEDLMENPHIIRNRRKLEACICHAKRMKEISTNFGSFGEFLVKHMGNNNELIEIIKRLFPRFVGNAVALDYLKDIGLDIIKPDRHVLRIFFRLGFIESEKLTSRNINEAIKVAEAIKRATSEKLMVIDAVFWMYGGGGNRHVKRAICRKEAPLCNECPITSHCRFYDLKRT